MRTATLVLALAAACAATPALSQARILTAPQQAPLQAQDQAPAPQAPAKDENPAPAEAPAQPPAQAQAPTPAPAQAQTPAKIQDQIPSQAQRQDRARPLVPGRYTFNRVDGGLLRLDRHSGEVAFCTPNTTGWVCEAVTQDRAALEQEIARLRDEVATVKDAVATTIGEVAAVKNEVAATKGEVLAMKNAVAALKNEIVRLRPPPPVPPQTVPPSPHSGKDGDAQIKLPTTEDVARARAFIADTWHRLVEMIENWQKDVLRKS
jgi:hypothetical protein